jgi:hypothetical protein
LTPKKWLAANQSRVVQPLFLAEMKIQYLEAQPMLQKRPDAGA